MSRESNQPRILKNYITCPAISCSKNYRGIYTCLWTHIQKSRHR